MSDQRTAANLTAVIDRLRARRPRVLVLGDVMLDRYLYAETSGRPNPECPDRPIRRCLRQEDRLGGAAAVAAMCAALGASVYLGGSLGTDREGLAVRGLLDDAGVRYRLPPIVSQETTVKVRLVETLDDGREIIDRLDRDGAPGRWRDVAEEAALWECAAGMVTMGAVQAVLVSDYGQGLLFPGHPHFRRLLVATRVVGVPTLVDPSRHARDWDRYRGAWLVKANLAEYRGLDALARAEARATFPAIVITAGERGLYLRQGHRFQVSQNSPRPVAGEGSGVRAAPAVLDPCGAGDQVLATLGCCLAVGVDRATACDLANRAGGLAVGRRGTQPVLLDELAASIL
jgi:rfaE bifunctional protein kinase chain/domain